MASLKWSRTFTTNGFLFRQNLASPFYSLLFTSKKKIQRKCNGEFQHSFSVSMLCGQRISILESSSPIKSENARTHSRAFLMDWRNTIFVVLSFTCVRLDDVVFNVLRFREGERCNGSDPLILASYPPLRLRLKTLILRPLKDHSMDTQVLFFPISHAKSVLFYNIYIKHNAS